jgi:hypothetical protein
MPREVKENPIGESIYNRIKDYDITSRKVFFKTITAEHKALYDKYNTFVRGQRRNTRYGNQELAREKAKEGMKKIREDRSRDELRQQRKPWDIKYNAKRKLSRDEASTIIQRQYRKNKQHQAKRAEATSIATSILNDLIDIAPNMKVVNGELKKKRGRKIH